MNNYSINLNNKKSFSFRGFEFHTTSTSAYPYHLLEVDSTININHRTFDLPRFQKIKSIPTAVALPKAITTGTLTVRENHKKNESKIPLDKRRGIKV